MHELNRVCHFVMGLSTWAKCKLKENWLASLSKAIMKMEGFLDVGWGKKSGFKKENKFLHKKARHEVEWNQRQDTSKGEKPKQFQGSNIKPKGNFIKKVVPFKVGPPKGMLVGSPKEHVSTVIKWGITPKIAPNPS
jgi:hypothetical protein